MASVTVDGQWVYDDRHAILESPVVQGQVSLGEALQRDFWGHKLGNPSKVSWRPALPLIWRALSNVSGGDPGPTRALAILAHIFATWALMRVVRSLHGSTVAIWVGALFALHPAHAEALGGVVGQADILAAGCGLMAMASLAEMGRSFALKTFVWLLVGALFKEVIVLYALVCLVLLIALRGKRPLNALHCAGLVGFVLLVALVQNYAHGGHAEHPKDNVIAALPMFERFINGLAIFWRGIRVSFLPFDVAANHGYAQYSEDIGPVLGAAALGGAVLFASVWAGVRWLLGGKPAHALWLSFGVGPALAQSHLLFVGPTEFAERLLYGGVGAACVVVVLLLTNLRVSPEARNKLSASVLVVLCGLFALGSWQAQRPWRAPLALWEHTLQREPLAWRAHHNYGDALTKNGQTQRGLWHLMMGVWLKRRLPKAVPLEVVQGLAAVEPTERLLMSPGVLNKNAPCVLIDGLIRAAYSGADFADSARTARQIFAQRYPCAKR